MRELTVRFWLKHNFVLFKSFWQYYNRSRWKQTWLPKSSVLGSDVPLFLPCLQQEKQSKLEFNLCSSTKPNLNVFTILPSWISKARLVIFCVITIMGLQKEQTDIINCGSKINSYSKIRWLSVNFHRLTLWSQQNTCRSQRHTLEWSGRDSGSSEPPGGSTCKTQKPKWDVGAL